MSSTTKHLEITAKQLEEGWLEYRPTKVSSTIRHRYVVLHRLPNGNAVVIDPASR